MKRIEDRIETLTHDSHQACSLCVDSRLCDQGFDFLRAFSRAIELNQSS